MRYRLDRFVYSEGAVPGYAREYQEDDGEVHAQLAWYDRDYSQYHYREEPQDGDRLKDIEKGDDYRFGPLVSRREYSDRDTEQDAESEGNQHPRPGVRNIDRNLDNAEACRKLSFGFRGCRLFTGSLGYVWSAR